MKEPTHNIKLYSGNNIPCPDSTWYEIAPHWYQNSARGWLGSGLTDCNGVEIFEGDIVKCWIEESNPRETEIYVVAFENGSFVLADTTDFINDIEALDIEVVGHIATE